MRADDLAPSQWLPEGKQAAVCWSIDDVHPGRSSDAYEAGGDCRDGALGHVEELLSRHTHLRVTLFVTPDWRPISVVPTRRILASVPFLRDRFHLAPVRAAGTMRLARHPQFVRYLRQLPRTEVALHGLHHLHRGRQLTVEFQQQSVQLCQSMLEESMSLFEEAGLDFVPGLQPPGWNLPSNLLEAADRLGLSFVASARDLETPVTVGAIADMSGLRGVSLFTPQWLEGTSILHLPINYQATSSLDRACRIIDSGGLLSIKSHIVKDILGYRMLDGLDQNYRDHLDQLFSALEQRYDGALWWTSMGSIAATIEARASHREAS